MQGQEERKRADSKDPILNRKRPVGMVMTSSDEEDENDFESGSDEA